MHPLEGKEHHEEKKKDEYIKPKVAHLHKDELNQRHKHQRGMEKSGI